MKLGDWVPELSEIDLTPLGNQKNSENNKKATVVERNETVIGKTEFR